MRRGLPALACGALLATAASASGASVVAPAVVIDGPSTTVVSVGGVALAGDGSGAVVYTKLVGGVPHVFASLETAGTWAPAVAVDGAVAGGASAPAVAVADGGRVAVVWVSGGMLYGAVRAGGTAAFTAPQAIAPASGTPALGMGISGTAYVAYPSAAANEVDIARLDRTATVFAPLTGPESATPVSLVGAPVIAVAADGTAIVSWTQALAGGLTNVYERRVSAAGPSPVLNDLTLPALDGLAGGSADSPQVGVAFDSSNAWASFRETLGGTSRIVLEQVLGDELRPALLGDSLGTAPGSQSASTPSMAFNGNAQGLLASAIAPSDQLVVSAHGTAAAPFAWTAGSVVNATANTVAPAPVAALAQDGRGLVAYAPSSGNLAAELFSNGAATGPFPLADAAVGPVLSGGGLAASADGFGDLAVAFLAGTSGTNAVLVDPVVTAPGAPRATGTQLWSADAHPTLTWQPSAEHWAPVTYAVSIDGRQVTTTTQTSYAPAALADGRHTWQVVATDPYGQKAPSAVRRLLIDSAPPAVAISLTGHHRHGVELTFSVTSTAISGIRKLVLDYGDGQSATAIRSTHAYAKAGSYTVSASVTDRAGVSATVRERVRIR